MIISLHFAKPSQFISFQCVWGFRVCKWETHYTRRDYTRMLAISRQSDKNAKILVSTYQCGEDVMIILCHHSHGESLREKVTKWKIQCGGMWRWTERQICSFQPFTHTYRLSLFHSLSCTHLHRRTSVEVSPFIVNRHVFCWTTEITFFKKNS